jgi:Sulfotransferase domain
MMRAWENRTDTVVVDEPFYAHYLDVTGIDHPGREEILAHHERDWRKVVQSLLAPPPTGVGILYQKQMSHHLLPDIGRDWLGAMTHAFLIRDPAPMLLSLEDKLGRFDIEATGLPQQVEIFDFVERTTGRAPPVLDSSDLLAAPRPVLRALCSALGIEFSERMLSWPSGPRASDGVWAKYWYERVFRTTAFEAPETTTKPRLHGRLAEIDRQCRPMYERLRAHRLRA